MWSAGVLWVDVWVGMAFRWLGLSLLPDCRSRTTLALRAVGVAIRCCFALAPRVPYGPDPRVDGSALVYSRLAPDVVLLGALMSDAAASSGFHVGLAYTLGMLVWC